MSRTSSIPVRLIDPRGHRFGAAFSVVLLAVAGLLDLPVLVAFVAVALGVSALFGTRWSILGRPWPIIRRRVNLGPPANPEPEFGPRFAQALGTIGLALAIPLIYFVSPNLAPWSLAAGMAFGTLTGPRTCA